VENDAIEVLEKRRAAFDSFRKERLPVLHKFSEAMGFENPHEILIFPKIFVGPIGDFIDSQVVSEANRVWLITRLGYFVGEIFSKEMNGFWMLDERMESETFSRYVIGDDDKIIIDPFRFSQEYVDSAPPRNFAKNIEVEIEKIRNNHRK